MLTTALETILVKNKNAKTSSRRKLKDHVNTTLSIKKFDPTFNHGLKYKTDR